MPRKDDDLLARLNALKPSSVTLEPDTPSIDIEVSQPKSVEDKLADRLKKLRNQDGAAQSISTTSINARSKSAPSSHVQRRVVIEKDTLRDWQQHGDDEQTLDELIAELGESEAEFKLDPDEPKHVEALLKEARAALPEDEETPSSRNEHDGKSEEQPSVPDPNPESFQTEDQQDEEEADEYVRRILAELEVEEKSADDPEPLSKDEADPINHPAATAPLSLPSTPANLKPAPPPSYEDSELEARLAHLGLNLPATPTAPPSSAKPRIQAALKPTSPNLPTFTDDDIASWCCICNADASLRCLGCDADLYCAECWRSGHGSAPGQERGHRAVAYARTGPQAQ